MVGPTSAPRRDHLSDSRPGVPGFGGQCERQLRSGRVTVGAHVQLGAERAAGQAAQ